MGHENYRKVLRQGVHGRPGIPIDDPNDPDKKRSTLLPRFVLAILADYANDEDEPAEAWPSISTLMRETGRDKRGIQRALRTLERAGLIEIVANPKGGATSRRYRLLLEEALQRIESQPVAPTPPTGGTDATHPWRPDHPPLAPTPLTRGADATRTPNNPHQLPVNPQEQGGGGGRDEHPSPPSVRSSGRALSLSKNSRKQHLETFLELLTEKVASTTKKKLVFDRSSVALRNLITKKVDAGWSLEGLAERTNTMKTWSNITNPTGVLITRLKDLPKEPDELELDQQHQRETEKEIERERERYNHEAAEILLKLENDPKFGRSRFRLINAEIETGSHFFLDRSFDDYYEMKRGKRTDLLSPFWIKETSQLLSNEIEELTKKLQTNEDDSTVERFLATHGLGNLLSAEDLEQRQSLPKLDRQIETVLEIHRTNCLNTFGLLGCPHTERKNP